MITRYGMSDDFDMVAMETVNNQYLGGDTSLSVLCTDTGGDRQEGGRPGQRNSMKKPLRSCAKTRAN